MVKTTCTFYSVIMKTNFKRAFGEKVKDYRILNNYAQQDFAELVGMSPNAISYIENGKNNISFAKLPVFSSALNIKIYQLFIDTDFEPELNITDNINKLLKTANKKQLGIIYNIVKNILGVD